MCERARGRSNDSGGFAGAAGEAPAWRFMFRQARTAPGFPKAAPEAATHGPHFALLLQTGRPGNSLSFMILTATHGWAKVPSGNPKCRLLGPDGSDP